MIADRTGTCLHVLNKSYKVLWANKLSNKGL